MRRIPPTSFHTYIAPRRVGQMRRHMGVDFPLCRGSRRLQDSGSFSSSILRTSFFQDFYLWFVIIDPFHLRIAMMAQAVIPCSLLLACRVQVVDDSTVPLLAEMKCGSYGVS